jgi:hypothetical protein
MTFGAKSTSIIPKKPLRKTKSEDQTKEANLRAVFGIVSDSKSSSRSLAAVFQPHTL